MKKTKFNNWNYAVGYCRYSSDNQSEASIDAQQRAIREYAKNEDIVIINWYVDKAQTGTTDNRKEFRKMIEDSKQHDFGQVLVYQMDRFARNREDTISYKVDLKRNGVKVVSVTERFDNSPEGKLMEAIVEGIAAYYSDDLSRKTLKNMKENAFNGFVNGGTAPYGYKLVPRLDNNGNPMYHKKGHALHDLAIDPERAEAVKIMFNMTLNGHTRGEVIEKLDELGYKRANGKSFIGTSIDNILRNEKYIGTYKFDCNKKQRLLDPRLKPDIVKTENALPAIISKDVFDGVQKILSERRHKQPKNMEENYFLTGKIFCGECGKAYNGLRVKMGEKYAYYKCLDQLSYKNGKKQENYCHNNSVRKDDIEKFVISKIKNMILNDRIIDDVLEEYYLFIKENMSNKSYLDMLEKQIEDTNKQIENIVNVISQGYANDVLLSQLQKLENQKCEYSDKLAKEKSEGKYKFPTREEMKQAYKKAREIIDNGNFAEKRKMLHNFINKIFVFKDHIEIYLNVVPTMLTGYIDVEIKHQDVMTLSNFIVEEEMEKEKAENSSLPFTNSQLFMGENQFGSPGRIRTYGLSVNSRALHH